MNPQTPYIILALGLFFSLLGAIISLAIYAARRDTTYRADIAQLRADQARDTAQLRADQIREFTQLRKDQERENAELRIEQKRDTELIRKDFVGISEKVRQANSNLWYFFSMVCFDCDPKRHEQKRVEVLNALTRWLS